MDPRRVLPSWCLLLLVLAACRADEQPPSMADAARVQAEVFETSERYSVRTVDSTELARFLADSPEYHADSGLVLAFYQRRGMQFAWFVDDSLSASAEAFLALSGVADPAVRDSAATDSALVVQAPPRPELGTLVASQIDEARRGTLCDSCATLLELRLTAEFFRFAKREYGGYFQRDLRELGWFIPRAKKDFLQLADSLVAGTMDLSAYEPLHPHYGKLKAQLARYRELGGAPWPALTLPARRPKLAPGDSADVVVALRHRLHQLGDLPQADSSARYDSTLVVAVRQFQLRHGLSDDGVIGPGVMAALNVAPGERLRTMLVNMERLRWVPDVQPANLLLVNIPEFRLHVYEAGAVVMSMRVVVGAVATHTVIFSDTVSTVVFNPTWTVPEEITRGEILPAIQKDPDYLRKQNMEIIGGTPEKPVIRQRSGPNNSLGRVKFLFPNSYFIYMHDTPERQFFARDRRAFSHGCIRLEDPRALAAYLLRNDSTWTRERMAKAMVGEKETHVRLTQRPPVMLVYFTAWEDVEGRLNFRDDVYGHDARLAKELFR